MAEFNGDSFSKLITHTGRHHTFGEDYTKRDESVLERKHTHSQTQAQIIYCITSVAEVFISSTSFIRENIKNMRRVILKM